MMSLQSKLQARDASPLMPDAYNATLEEIRDVHGGLRVIRVRADQGPLEHAPGQYTMLGLGEWEPFVTEPGRPPLASAQSHRNHVLKRAYSFSSRILTADGQLVDPTREDPAEFYIALVPATTAHPPGLTPRLFALRPGDRLLVGEQAKGTYTLAERVRPDDDVLLAATGTGEAPHNGMVASLLAAGHRGRIVSTVCVRYERDLAYLAAHRELERRYPNYRYLPLTTREPRNLDPQAPGYVGKQYLQQFLTSPALADALGRPLTPGRLSIFLCGSPEMIGAPQSDGAGGHTWPTPRGMLETLVSRGFRIAEHGHSGDVHYERYW